MTERIHIVVDREEKERYRRVAARRGLTLSEWLRQAALEKAEQSEHETGLDDVDALRAFFEVCERREKGDEPDWDEHLRVIHGSQQSGAAPT